MRLNTLKPAAGSTRDRKRVGRGAGSGMGKTSGRGHKGQKARSGGYHKVGFEGGQMPLQRRLPKRGFHAPFSNKVAQIRLHELANVAADVVDVDALKKAGLITKDVLKVKVFLSGELKKAISLKGISVSKGAREAISQAGGKVED